MLIFTIFTKITFNDFDDQQLDFRADNKPLNSDERARWETRIIHSNVSRMFAAPPIPKEENPVPLYGSERSQHLWPDYAYGDDRILAQINYVPSEYHTEDAYIKVIYVPGGLGETPEGKEKFLSEECVVSNCRLTINRSEQQKAHALLIQSSGDLLDNTIDKPSSQIWILWVLESPLNTVDYGHLGNRVNWTATYRRDSTIVTPYEKFVPFRNASEVLHAARKNYAASKTKMAAWFVSNCGAKNQRWELVEELQKYITVEIYGACGSLTCLRMEEKKCFQMLSNDYKFYFSFENSNCRDYITEKFFWNALL
jgi:glycoprotein 3-alpha-L-fucosyltransferase